MVFCYSSGIKAGYHVHIACCFSLSLPLWPSQGMLACSLTLSFSISQWKSVLDSSLLALTLLLRAEKMTSHQVLQLFSKGVDVISQDSEPAVSPLFVKALCMSVVPRHDRNT